MISFIIPVKNESKYISEALINLIGGAGSKTFEVILVDDASTDNTFDIVVELTKSLPHVTIIKNPGKGKVEALNAGYEKSSGEIIKCIDGDDILDRKFFDFLDLHEKYDALYHNYDIVRSDLSYLNTYRPRPSFYNKGFEWVYENLVSLPRCVWSFNRSIADKIFPMPTSLPFEDVWFSMSIKYYSQRLHYLDESLYKYRQHSNQTYGGILNFEPEINQFRAKRMLKVINTLETLDPFQQKNNFKLMNNYYHLIADQKGFLDVILAPIGVSLKAKIILLTYFRWMLPAISVLKWKLS